MKRNNEPEENATNHPANLNIQHTPNTYKCIHEAVKMFNKEDRMISLIICSQFALLFLAGQVLICWIDRV